MISQRAKIKDQKYNVKNFALGYSLLICLFVYLFIGLFAEARAAGVGLKLSPSVLQIEVQSPSEINAPISIENLEDSSVDLTKEFRLFKTNDKDNGQIEYLPLKENNSGIFSKVSLLDGENNLSKLTLGPKQKKDLNLKIIIDENEPPGDYYFSIIFTSIQDSFQPAANSNEQKSISKINAGIAMNIILSIQEPKNKDAENIITASIEEFASPKFIEKGPVPFTIGIKNTGDHFIRPKGTIEITNMFGQLIGKINLPSTNILARSRRYLENKQTTLNPKPYPLTPEVLWQENFLLGFYTAKLKIQTSPDSTELTQTIHFTALPFRLIITIIATIIIFLIIRKRVKKKMSQR